MPTTSKRPQRGQANGGSNGSKSATPLIAGGAAAAGLAAGTVVGTKLLSRRRTRVLGVPMPKASEIMSGAEWLGRMQSDLRAVRAQAEVSRKQSPIEVVLSALTSRRLPKHSD